MQGDLALFFRELALRPHQIVALAPSSEALAREMAVEIDPNLGPVIELGAGTGKITRAILARGVAPESLHAIEMNAEFCTHLRQTFPGVQVHQKSAGDLGSLPLKGVQAVVSGLPLLSMPKPLQEAILGGTCRLLRPGGTFVQFTYGPKPPVTRAVREVYNLEWCRSPKIWGNLPPARVYRFWPAM